MEASKGSPSTRAKIIGFAILMVGLIIGAAYVSTLGGNGHGSVTMTGQQATYPITGTFYGQVVDAFTKQGVSSATVQLRDGLGHLVATALTNASGWWRAPPFNLPLPNGSREAPTLTLYGQPYILVSKVGYHNATTGQYGGTFAYNQAKHLGSFSALLDFRDSPRAKFDIFSLNSTQGGNPWIFVKVGVYNPLAGTALGEIPSFWNAHWGFRLSVDIVGSSAKNLLVLGGTWNCGFPNGCFNGGYGHGAGFDFYLGPILFNSTLGSDPKLFEVPVIGNIPVSAHGTYTIVVEAVAYPFGDNGPPLYLGSTSQDIQA